jgi:hypothetical protein
MKPLIFIYLCCIGLLTPLSHGTAEPLDSGDPLLELNEAGDAFTFVRVRYDTAGGGNEGEYWHRGPWHTWSTDYPASDRNFLRGVRRLTHIHVNKEPIVLRLDDDRIFEYPFLYMLEVGRQGGLQLSPKETRNLREYLLRGGFLVVDDFHGTLEWASFLESMTRVFPDRPIVDIPEDDEAFHVHFDLDQRIQIPSAGYISRGVTWEKDGFTPHWRGIYDDDGRLMVAINFNMDLGDAWEHADWPEYPEAMTSLAYRFGVNYVIYAMTH